MIKRRNYFINRKFQASFAVKFMVLLLVEILLIAGLFAYISGNTLTTGYSDSVLTIERTSSYFLFPMVIIVVMTAVGIGIAGMVMFILLSHRMAGPLYRFEKDLTEISRGNLSKRITLRKTDEFTSLKEVINTVMSNFDGKITRIKIALEKLEAAAAAEPQNMQNIRDAIGELSKEIEYFKVTSAKNG